MLMDSLSNIQLWGSVLMGFTQGLTEFLPISSSGHLFLIEQWLGVVPNLLFEVLLHVASLLAVVLYFWRDLIICWQQFFKRPQSLTEFVNREPVQLIIATICTIPFGLLIEHFFRGNMTISFVGATLLATAGFIFFSDKWHGSKTQLTLGMVVILGLVQGVAAFPGISRSGITIACLLIMNVDRYYAARFSFLLSIPTILAALLLAVFDAPVIEITTATSLGFIVSFITSLFGIKWLMDWVSGKWSWFGFYCVILGIILLFLP